MKYTLLILLSSRTISRATAFALRVLQAQRWNRPISRYMSADAPGTEDSTPEWEMYFDLQCPYSKTLRNKSFAAHSASFLIGTHMGEEAREKFENACYASFDLYSDEATEKMTKADLHEVFGFIAEGAGLFEGEFSKEIFLENIGDWKGNVMPTWFEHKEALTKGVLKAPQHVLNGKLLEDTESSWDVHDYEARLQKKR